MESDYTESGYTESGADELPSNLVWVSGPSRSADLELVLTVGVHGPRTVDVIVVEQDSR
jgi:L-lactate dehydrogenase complex protein LldG